MSHSHPGHCKNFESKWLAIMSIIKISSRNILTLVQKNNLAFLGP